MARSKAKAEDEVRDEGRMIRVAGDIADMLSWIEYFENRDREDGMPAESIRQIVDPWLRAAVIKRYAAYQKRAEDVTRASGRAVVPGRVPLPLGRKK